MDSFYFLIIGIAIGAAAGWGISLYRRPKSVSSEAELADARARVELIGQQLEQARAEISATRTPTDTRFQTKWSLHQHRQCSGSRGAKQ